MLILILLLAATPSELTDYQIRLLEQRQRANEWRRLNPSGLTPAYRIELNNSRWKAEIARRKGYVHQKAIADHAKGYNHAPRMRVHPWNILPRIDYNGPVVVGYCSPSIDLPIPSTLPSPARLILLRAQQ